MNGINRAINASCMYEVYDEAIEKLDPKCFAKCAQPLNVTSSCYLTCFDAVVSSATQDELTAPWGVAFEICPPVHIDEVKEILQNHENFIEKSLNTLIQ